MPGFSLDSDYIDFRKPELYEVDVAPIQNNYLTALHRLVLEGHESICSLEATRTRALVRHSKSGSQGENWRLGKTFFDGLTFQSHVGGGEEVFNYFHICA